MIEILSTPSLVTVQDLGRSGFYRYGVCRSGAMDRLSLAIGNLLLGNDRNAAGLEIPILPLRLRFEADVNFAVTGADCSAELDGRPLPPFWAARARAGEVLTLAAPRAGCRAYLCLAGGVDVPEVLSSRSTQLRETFGGLDGRALVKGDRIKEVGNDVVLPEGGLGAVPPAAALADADAPATTVRVIPAAEHADYDEPSRAAFWAADWKVTVQSNRAGYRLKGPELQLRRPIELRSHGVVPGVIQVPAGGQPIIQLADAATMGGYPKIGVVIDADLWRIAQARPGDSLRFIETDVAGAALVHEETEAYLDGLEHDAGRQHRLSAAWRT
ncbi:biotin-dependent carboxyltransferase family protein [Sinorhizobium alkalisoli]|uniref:5-oxoprolinase subunit C family protein n=1 Tax=Sinorhizobium alkalisoli TaxID=1752398 RepID=UPI00124E01BE|nr:biotin-dependent carboxyltransferase family protein [Sinorhizobium alkalisoli]MCG5480680.1 biotin-dependent carboxyltransferase family protein [Sinorhizobium alkalisoli]QFI69422.1 Allophanate hydrolase subunit [Sinorhizobium alkalisoli]